MLWFPGKPSAPHDVDERHQWSHFQRLIARVHWLPCRDEERGTPISVARPRGLNLYTCISFMNRVFSSPTVSTVSLSVKADHVPHPFVDSTFTVHIKFVLVSLYK